MIQEAILRIRDYCKLDRPVNLLHLKIFSKYISTYRVGRERAFCSKDDHVLSLTLFSYFSCHYDSSARRIAEILL